MTRHLPLLFVLAVGVLCASGESTPGGMFVMRPTEGRGALYTWERSSVVERLSVPARAGRSAVNQDDAGSSPAAPTNITIDGGASYAAERRLGAENGDLAQVPSPANTAAQPLLWWWERNDGTPVYVAEAFYYPALTVVPKESGWNADAWDGYHCGWFQIAVKYHAWRFTAHGWDIWTDCWDAGKNSTIAHEIWAEQGWRPWPNTARGHY